MALISDIHGNLPALEAVLAGIERGRIDDIVCLGDLAVFGPQPAEVVRRLRGLDLHKVMGNTDAWLLSPRPHPYRDEDTGRVSDVELWGAAQLEAADIDFVRSFPRMVELDLGNDVTLLAFHGSPRSDRDLILSTTPEDELKDMLAGQCASIMAGGHSHRQLLRRCGEAILVNPGSVGQAFETDPVAGESRLCPWAEYAVVSLVQNELRVEFRRVPFDLEALLRLARARKMPHCEWWTGLWGER